MRHVSDAGAFRKANVGMSNDKFCENQNRRKTKGSSIDVNQIRVSRVLRGSRKANLMANGSTFPYLLRAKKVTEGFRTRVLTE
jgi:hypothetical protein